MGLDGKLNNVVRFEMPEPVESVLMFLVGASEQGGEISPEALDEIASIPEFRQDIEKARHYIQDRIHDGVRMRDEKIVGLLEGRIHAAIATIDAILAADGALCTADSGQRYATGMARRAYQYTRTLRRKKLEVSSDEYHALHIALERLQQTLSVYRKRFFKQHTA